jgi:tetratricopeptide (TPR) repeat protein
LVRGARIQDTIEKQFQSPGLFGAGAKAEDESYSETFYPFGSFGWSPLHALETSRYHFIDAPDPELYDLTADPEEKKNLAAQQTATVAVLKEKLQARLRNHPFTPSAVGGQKGGSQLSPDALEKLRALGYFGFHAAVSPESLEAGLADPKDRLREFNTILKAEDALQQHNDDQAEAFLRQVQEQDPHIYVIPFLLGESALRRQNWERAADQLQRCLELNPNFDNAMTGLARALSKLGRLAEAKGWLQKALQSNPENYRAWYESGLLEAVTDSAAALSAYQKASAIQPNFSPGQRELGMALFNQKDYAAAAIHLEKASALGLDDAHLHNFLGICYSQMHRISKAAREHKRAVELEPNLAEAHLNLAYDYQLLHRPKAAQQEYNQACKLEEEFCKFAPAQ